MQLKLIAKYVISVALLTMLAMVITYPLGNIGYLNLSEAAIVLLLSQFEPGYSLLGAGLGCVIADYLLGYKQILLITFIIRAIQGLLASLLKDKNVLVGKCLVIFIGLVLFMISDYSRFGLEVMKATFLQRVICMITVLLIVLVISYVNKMMKRE